MSKDPTRCLLQTILQFQFTVKVKGQVLLPDSCTRKEVWGGEVSVSLLPFLHVYFICYCFPIPDHTNQLSSAL